MNERWIGDIIDTSGFYQQTACEGLRIRNGSMNKVPLLYRFECITGNVYFVSKESIVERIASHLDEKRDTAELGVILHEMIIDHYGLTTFLEDVKKRSYSDYRDGVKAGEENIRRALKSLIGVSS